MENNKNKMKLLFVDDEENILKSLRRLFRPKGYSIFIATSGVLGLKILESEAIDLVISDMRMPEMDGATFLKQVSARWPDIIRILLTGYADLNSTVSAINEGHIYCYASKPWEDYNLSLTVEQALERRNLKKEKENLEGLTRQQNKELIQLNADLEFKVAERTGEVREALLLLEGAHGALKHEYQSSLKDYAALLEELKDEKKTNESLRQALKEMNEKS